MNAFVILLVAVVCVMIFLASCHKIFQRIWCALNCAPFPRNEVQIRRFSEAVFEDPSLQFQSHGLESSVMQSLPTTRYKEEDEEEQRPRNNECAICLGEFEEGEWLKHLPNCAHFFHLACIDAWFQTHSNCPLCRSLVYDTSLYRDCSISMHSLLETLNREDFLHGRAAYDQVIRSEILQNPALRPEETGGVQQPGIYLQSIWTA